MNIFGQNRPVQTLAPAGHRESVSACYSSFAASRAIAAGRQRRERILACLAFVMLIVAWDATLRLDERISPPRMRTSHAVEIDGEQQMMTTSVE